MVLWGKGNCQAAEEALLLLLPQIWSAREHSDVSLLPGLDVSVGKACCIQLLCTSLGCLGSQQLLHPAQQPRPGRKPR